MHQRQRAGQPERSVVNESVERTELLAEVPDQLGDVVDLAEIERHKRKRALPFLLARAIAAAISLLSLRARVMVS